MLGSHTSLILIGLPTGLETGIFFNLFFNWRKIALQCCVGFCRTTAQISHNYTHIPSLLSLTPLRWFFFLKYLHNALDRGVPRWSNG